MKFIFGKKVIFLVFFLFLFFALSNRETKIENETKISKQEVKGSVITPSTAFPQTNNAKQQGIKVKRVIDGDTIELEAGQKVRLIGIDSPESVDPREAVQCFGKEAYSNLKTLLEEKIIKLEKDISETDKYGRLLRYVYLDKIFINETLVRTGFAKASSYPPDIKFQGKFREAEAYARNNSLGLWDSCPNTKNGRANTGLPSSLKPNSNFDSSGDFSCDCSKPCSDISSCTEAQFQLENCGCSKRDGDGDGIACDGAPLKCQN